MSDDRQPARQFGKLYWDEPGSLRAAVVAAFVRYRCYRGPEIITRTEFQEALRGAGKTVTIAAVQEALDLGLIHRRPSRRPGDHNLQLYSCDLRDLVDMVEGGVEDGPQMQTSANPDVCKSGQLDVRNPVKVVRNPDKVVREPAGSRPDLRTSHEAPAEELEETEGVEEDARPREPLDTQTIHAKPACASAALVGRHLAIQAASRAVDTTPDGPQPLRLTREYIRAIESVGVGGWAREVMASKWEAELAEVVEALGLTPEQVASVLESWDRAAERLTPAQRAKAEQDGSLPSRRAVWWWRSRPWLTAQLEALERASAAPKRSTVLALPRPEPEAPRVVTPEQEAALWRAIGAEPPRPEATP